MNETIAPIPILAQTEERSLEIVAETELAPGNITVTEHAIDPGPSRLAMPQCEQTTKRAP